MNINIKLDKKAKSVVAKTANISGGDTPAGGKILTATCTWGSNWNYASEFRFATTDSSISTFDDLFNWLEENGYIRKGILDDKYYPWIHDNTIYVDEQHASNGSSANLNAISAYTKISPKGNRRGIFLDGYPTTVTSDNVLWEDEMPADFAITFLGNE